MKEHRISRALGVVAAMAVLVAACSGASDDGPASSIEAQQVGGVWVFSHDPTSGMDALHGGTPEIVDGCLVIDDTIVVWHVDTMDEAAAAVAAAQAGESPPLLIAGGGLSVEEGSDPADIPGVITDRCSTDAVWFGAAVSPSQ